MSYWYEPKKEDISVNDLQPDELTVYLGQDDFGAIYVSLKIEDLKEIITNNQSK